MKHTQGRENPDSTMETRQMTIETNEKTISVPEAGRRYFDIKKPGWLLRRSPPGDIPTIRIGRRIRVPVRALERMLDNATVEVA
jgi:hypothetical protein